MINECYFGDCRDSLDKMKSEGIVVQSCITSPPYYGVRDYGNQEQIGLEQTPEEYINNLVEVFQKVREILSDDGTLWINIGDSYYNYRPGNQSYPKQTIASNKQDLPTNSSKRNTKLEGYKEKDLIGIPWMLAFALRNDGWYLRQDIIWSKPNPMPESVKDRCTKSHEYIFLLSKNQNYYFDCESIQEPTVDGSERKRKKSVWEVQLKPYKGAHFATYPIDLIVPCVLASSRTGDVILDPFFGSGTTGLVCDRYNRNWIGCELNENYKILQDERLGRIGLHSFLQ